ncbi:uncharacterized protein LOC118180426, partial [Stegodyphus dumicola]|uniref:uncharacterized protein LOC118180426 n=1 Tax=Stegodyphus dumicola TaxID=202533 RepID=UPI0015A81D46
MAYRYCRFKGCNRKIESKSDGIHFYRFPKEEQRCQAWVKASQNEKLVGVPASDLHKRAYLCMVHFEDWCFVNITTKHRLVHNAVPCSTKLQVTKGLVPDKVPELSHMTVPNSVTNGSVRDKMPEINHITVPSSEHHQSDFQQELISNVQGPNNLYQNVCSTELSTCNASLMSLIPQQSFSAPVSCSTPKSHYSGKKIHTQKITIVKKKVKKYRDMARRLKLKFVSSKKKFSTAHSLEKTLSSQGVSKKLSSFIQRQVTLNTQKTKRRRFTHSDKIDAYRIYSKSRAAYRVLKEFLELPAERTLQRFVSSKLSCTGISADIISALKQVLQNKENHERMFALIFDDEMSLKPCLVGGFPSDSIANHVLVLMLRSLTSKKKLPLGFYFSNHAINAERLREILTEALTKLSDANAVVKALVCDQGGNNSRLFRILGVDSLKPFFDFNGQTIYCLFDPPHLLKNLRRNLMKYDLQTSKGFVSFKYIRDFHEVDKTLLIRCAPKMTDAHLNTMGLNSMKVALAAQVFSHTVAAGMNLCILSGLIEASAAPTVEFILKIDNLFDSMNGTRKNPLRGKQLHCAVKEGSAHINFWKEMIAYVESWVF